MDIFFPFLKKHFLIQSLLWDLAAPQTSWISWRVHWMWLTFWPFCPTTSASSWREWRTPWWWAEWARFSGSSELCGFSECSRWLKPKTLNPHSHLTYKNDFQLVRHFNGLQSLLITLGQAYKELFLLMGLLFVAVLTFASLIYFAERDSTSNWSFLESFWWGLMVLTTVGIGDKSPHSVTGQVEISVFCSTKS